MVAHRFGLAERRARIDLPGGPLEIDWDPASDHLFMTGPAVAVFDGVVTPELWGDDPAGDAPDSRIELVSPAQAPDGVPGAAASVDCASVCVNGCIRPEACPSAEARARVQALLNNSSLDDLVALATESLETRTRARFERTTPPGG